MAQCEKLFEMLELIREHPDLTPRDLARLCDISIRTVYRCLNTLSKVGFSIRFRNGGYKLEEDYSDIIRKADRVGLEALKVLLSAGMWNYRDDRVLSEYGREFMKLIEMNLSEERKRRLDEIEIIPEGVETAYYGGTIAIGHSSKPDIINPILTSETISVNLLNLIFSSLVKFDSAQRPVPDLAKDWEVSKDGLVWTFFLRDDVKFHDDHPLTAHDVEFTYRTIMDPKNTSPMAERYELIDRIETESDYVFRMILKYPFAPLMCRLGWPIAPKHLLENLDLYKTPFNRRPVGSGPFKLADWTEDDAIVLDANRQYFHRGRPVLDRLIFRAYPDRGAALRSITRGEMDIALDLAASDLLFVSRQGSFRVYPALGASYYAIAFSLRNPIFRDIRVRKALDYAIDKGSIIKNQLKGYSEICTGPFNVNSWACNPHVQPAPYSTEKAKELLGQAGWLDTDGDGVLDRDGEPLEISLAVSNISDFLERIAVAVRAQLMKVGVRVKLIHIDDSKLYRTPLQAILVKRIAGADPDYAYRFWHSEGGDANLASYESRFVDDLLEQGRRTADLEKRKAIYHKIHEIIHDDCPAIFLASGCEFIGSNYRFRDARFSSLVHFLTTIKDWQIVGGERRDTIRRRQQEVNTGS
jgi:peptide/nickel transport system substrate-binding protein